MTPDALAPGLAYWRQQLRDVPSPPEPLTDRPRNARAGFHANVHRRAIPDDLVQGVEEMATRAHASPFMTLLTVFELLLAKLTGERDVVVGTPIASRPIPQADWLIGYFVNPVALRTNLNGAATFRDALGRVRNTVMGALAHRRVPLSRVVEALRADGRMVGPLFQMMFVVEHPPARILSLPAVEVTAEPFATGTTRFEITLAIEQWGREWTASWHYHTDLYETSSVERMAAAYEQLLRRALANPDADVWALSPVDDTERERLSRGLNETAVVWRDRRALAERFVELSRSQPDAAAIYAGDEVWSYAELAERALALASALVAQGVRPDDVVGICASRSSGRVAAVLACMLAGAAYLPLEPELPAARIAYMLEDARARAWLVDSSAPPLASSLPSIPLDGAPPAPPSSLRGAPPGPPSSLRGPTRGGWLSPVAVLPDNLAYVIYTSGSTGAPKAVMSTHGGLLNRLLWMQRRFTLSPGDRVLHKTPFGFDVSVWELLWPLCFGAAVVVAEPGGHRDARYLTDLVRQREVTLLHFVPSMFSPFLEQDLSQCRSVRAIVCSGEALTAPLVDGFRRVFPEPDVELHNLYGPTEASIDITAWRCDARPDRRVPIGSPIANSQALILDEHLQVCAVGSVGELYLGGAGLARGYLGKPALTAERFVPDPFALTRGGRLYRSGDLARRLADDCIEFVARVDHQVKIRGMRVELGEVEAALRAHHAVRQAVVLMQTKGAVQKLIAFVTPDLDSALRAELVAELRKTLPEHMVPHAVVGLEAFPQTSSGKINRRELLAIEPELVRESEPAPPRTPIERSIASMVQELLGVENIGVHASIYALGGHSLLLMQLAARFEKEFGVQVPLRRLFDTPTVAEMALAVCASQGLALEHDEAEQLLREVEQMSEQELDAILSNEGSPA
jgi:amino acid adenylation domain-containing protein